MKKDKKFDLTQLILLSLVLGVLLGILLHYLVPSGYIKDQILIEGVFYVLGQGFMRLLQMLVVPLVFFSLASGAMAMGDSNKLGKVGLLTLTFYLLTTAIAIAIAIGFSSLIKPGSGMDLVVGQNQAMDIADPPKIQDTLLNIIPTNPVQSLAQGEMLQIILFAILVGYICSRLPDEFSVFSRFLHEGNTLMMEMTSLVMKLAPIGVFCLIAKTFSQLGLETFVPMIKYMLSVLLSLILHVGLVYVPILLILGRLNPRYYIKKVFPAFAFAFTSASSGATIPITLRSMDTLGVPRSVSSFTIPLGATVNMDGTAIMQGCAVVFTSLAFDIPLTISDYMTVIVTATLASVGTASIPAVGLITLSMVLKSVNLPVESIALLMGIDRILDMARTAVNTTGDGICTVVVSRLTGVLDLGRYYDRNITEENEEF